MARQQYRHILVPPQPFNQFYHPVGCIRIQTESRLVQKRNFGILNEQFSQTETLAHTPGIGTDLFCRFVGQSDGFKGTLNAIVRRPAVDEREVLEQGELDVTEGLIGDNWQSRGSGMTADGSAHPDMQLNIMNARVIALVATSRERWALAGDQLFVDLELSRENLPPGTRLALGTAVVEVTDVPHQGCRKFADRFGVEATKFVNSKRGKQLGLRGINAKVVKSGVVRNADSVTKLP